MRLTDEVQTLLDTLNTEFSRVEEMTGAEARAAVARNLFTQHVAISYTRSR